MEPVPALQGLFYWRKKMNDNKTVYNTIPEKEEQKCSRKTVYSLIAILLLIVLLILLLQRCTQGTLEDTGTASSFSDPITNGSLTEEEREALQPDYFNVKLNATPAIENGKMNLRAENNSQKNLPVKLK